MGYVALVKDNESLSGYDLAFLSSLDKGLEVFSVSNDMTLREFNHTRLAVNNDIYLRLWDRGDRNMFLYQLSRGILPNYAVKRMTRLKKSNP